VDLSWRLPPPCMPRNRCAGPSTNTPTVSAARNLHSLQTRKRGNHVVGFGNTFSGVMGIGSADLVHAGRIRSHPLVLAVVVVVIRVIQGRRVT